MNNKQKLDVLKNEFMQLIYRFGDLVQDERAQNPDFNNDHPMQIARAHAIGALLEFEGYFEDETGAGAKSLMKKYKDRGWQVSGIWANDQDEIGRQRMMEAARKAAKR